MPQALKSDLADWIVVTTHRLREDIAATNLSQQNFKPYCPKMLKQVRHARRVCEVKRPLFPGYIFMEMPSDTHRLRHVLGTVGVRGIVTTGEKPAKLPAGFVESLRAREAEGHSLEPEISFRPGQRVEISGGVFDGLIAQVMTMKEQSRVMVLLDILKRETRVDLDIRDLRSHD